MTKSLSLVRVPEGRVDEFLDKFFMESTFTFEGLDVSKKNDLKKLEKVFREHGYTKDVFLMYWFSGKEMNEKYKLTGDNRYPDDLTFVTIPEYYNPMLKMLVGARWFDDIVQTNLETEMEMAQA